MVSLMDCNLTAWGREPYDLSGMRPPRPKSPVALWMGLVIAALVLQVPVVFFLKSMTNASGNAPASTYQKPMHASIIRHRPQKKKKKVEPYKPIPKGQVVEVRAPEKEVPAPKRARYLSEHNTRTKKETRARPNKRRNKTRLGAPAPRRTSKVQSRRSRSLKRTTSAKKQPKTAFVPKSSRAKALKKRGERVRRTRLIRRAKNSALRPTVDAKSAIANLQAMTGAASSNDALPKIKTLADRTSLSSRRFVHSHYFNKIKNRVKKHWQPAPVYRRTDPTGKTYGVKDRLTVVRVTLNSTGKVNRLITVRNSGMDALDIEARRALNRAGPFGNPPDALLDKGGRLVFQFGFLFEISSSRFKFFRMAH
jgi:hypothetical protein